MLGAKQIVATDIHPTTLQQLEYGISRNDRIDDDVLVQTEILDLFATEREQPIPPCDLLIVADVLYSEILASQVCRRCAEALKNNPNIRILITDSQRFVPDFIDELNEALKRVQVLSSHTNNNEKDDEGIPLAAWRIQTMKKFKGSGVIIDEDQTYDVTVQSLWIGL
jgi:predicted nicotinamide N-methyase